MPIELYAPEILKPGPLRDAVAKLKKKQRKRRKQIPRGSYTRDPWGNLLPDLQHLQNQISILAKRVEDMERMDGLIKELARLLVKTQICGLLREFNDRRKQINRHREPTKR
jgi:hypothetical protein